MVIFTLTDITIVNFPDFVGYWLWFWQWWLSQVSFSSFLIHLLHNIKHVIYIWYDTSCFCSYVHGRLPYDNLKPDPVLRHLLLSLPIRKVVSLCASYLIDKPIGQLKCLLGNRVWFPSDRFSQMLMRFMWVKFFASLDWRIVLMGL